MYRRPLWLAVLVVPVASLILALSLFDPNLLKPRLVDAVAEATGRTLTLGGPLRVRWSLWPTLVVSNAELANLSGGSRPDMVRVERIEAQISLLPLLSHRLEIVRLTLTGPNILFEQVGDTPNWVFDTTPPADAGRAGHAPSTSAVAGPSARLLIRKVDVRNGMLTFHFPARTRVIGVRSLDFSQAILGGALDLSSVLVYSDFQPFTLHAHATPTAQTGNHRADPWTTALDLAAFDATASARGTVDLIGGYDLRISAVVPALEALNALLPQMHLPALHGMTLSTHIRNGPARGDLPVIGASRLHVASAKPSDRIPGLVLDTLDLSLPKAGGLATLASGGSYAGQPITIAGTVGVPEHPDSPSSIPVDLKATLAGAPAKAAAQWLAVDGKVGLRKGGFDGLDAMVSLNAPSLVAFRPMLSPLLPALTAISFNAQLTVTADARTASVRSATIQAAEAAATGDFQVGLGTTRSLSGTLHASRIDLDALTPPFGKPTVPAADGGSKTSTLFPTTPIAWSTLRGPTIDLATRIDALTYQRQSWTAVALTVRLQAGRLQFDPLHLTLPGGSSLNGSLDVDASVGPAKATLVLKAPSIPLALLATAIRLPGPVTGNLALSAQLRASGDTPHALGASLDGPFSMTVVGGEMSNAALISLASASLDALKITVPEQGRTPIRCFGLIGAFTGGLGRLSTIVLDTGYLELSGEGRVDLVNDTLALKLHPLAMLSGARVAVPVLVDGPIRAPKSRLDASGLDKLGLLIDAWFGGDHPRSCVDAGLVVPGSVRGRTGSSASAPGAANAAVPPRRARTG